MGCMESKSEQEILLDDLWLHSKICQTSPLQYIDSISDTIISLKKENNKDLENALIERIIKLYLNSDFNFEVFEQIKYHFINENKKQKLGHILLFVLIFLIDSNKKEKLEMMIEITILIEDIYNINRSSLKTNRKLFKNLLTVYIDLVSFCTLGYYMKYILNKNKKEEKLVADYNRVFRTFRIANREKLLNKFIGNNTDFDMDLFFENNKNGLEHFNIRKSLIQMDYADGKIDNNIKDNANINKEIATTENNNRRESNVSSNAIENKGK